MTLTLDLPLSLSLLESLTSLNLLAAEVDLLSKWLGYLVVGLQVAAGLGFVIFVHELGHFLAAKTFGVKCEKFYVGFDVPITIGPIRLPSTLGKFRWGETEYGIGIVPLGGYVKMLGQDDDPRHAEEEAKRIRLGDDESAPLDPRSYPAKPVWQRMIIISAGVVMNIIFAVILAAIAFLYGVPYSPAVVGSSPLGAPAWAAGVKPGDRVLRVAGMKQDDPYLRYEEMAGKAIVHGMRHQDAPVNYSLERAGERLSMEITPTKKLHPDGFYLVGIAAPSITTLGDSTAVGTYSYLAEQQVPLKPLDRVVAVDGKALPEFNSSGVILSAYLTDALQAKWNQPVELTVKRRVADATGKVDRHGAEEEVIVKLPAVPVKTLGLGFAMGPITAIQTHSLAETAGLKVGDVIVAVDGQPVLDAMRLPMQVAERIGKPVQLKVRRPAGASASGSAGGSTGAAVVDSASGEELTFVLDSPGPATFGSIGDNSASWGLANLGIAYDVSPRISWIDPAAAKATSAVQVGDILTEWKLEPTPAELADDAQHGNLLVAKQQSVSSLRTIPTFFNRFQQLPAGINIRCFLKRDNETREVVLPLNYATDWYWSQRGVLLQPLELTQATTNFLQASQWGFMETGRRLQDVFEFLTIILSGRASPRNLAGPFGIAEVAASEASNSPARLLLFLTLLSANLAILNFLPIPALDGGHLMFLIAEAIRGKPLNEAIQMRLTMLGVFCLLGLMIFAVINDILRKVM